MKIINYCALLLLTCPLAFSSSNKVKCAAIDDESTGMTFSSSQIYEIDCPFHDSINTFEAVISLPNTITESCGTILGSKGAVCGSLNFDIQENGVPKVSFVDLDQNEANIVFNKVDVRSNSKVHLTIVNDYVYGRSYCYIDGELKQIVNSSVSDYSYIKSFVLGGDWSSTVHNCFWETEGRFHEPEECLNTSYFKGTLYEVALYSSIRSKTEIKQDIEEIDDLNKDLFAHYVLDGQVDKITNKAGYKYTIYNRARHLNEEDIPELKDYEYSMAILGDTQYTCYRHPDLFPKIFEDLRDHAANQKLKYVISMGDNCDQDTDTEWALVQEQYKTLDGIVGYAVTLGNHESKGQINKYFSNSDYLSTLSGCFEGNNVENSYRFLRVGDVKYIIFTFGYGPDDEVLNWAGDICDSFPDHKVICTTHGYLYSDGTTLDENDPDVPTKEGEANTGVDYWNKFVSKHKNIVLALCGHISSDDVLVRQEKGENGNVVTSMLVNDQPNDLYDKRINPTTGQQEYMVPLGMIYYLYFSKDGSHVQARYYSPIQDIYLSHSNQREITLYEGIDFDHPNMKKVITDENVVSVDFEKDSYNVGDVVNFNINLVDGYQVDSATINDEVVSVSLNENYAYSYVAGEKDYLKITSKIKEEEQVPEEEKHVIETEQTSYALPIIFICLGVVFAAAAAFLFIKKKV